MSRCQAQVCEFFEAWIFPRRVKGESYRIEELRRASRIIRPYDPSSIPFRSAVEGEREKKKKDRSIDRERVHITRTGL